MQISLNLETSCCKLKIRVPGIKLFDFSIILILKGIMILYDKIKYFMILRILLNKNINLTKNETESKMENPTHSFIEINLAFQLI